MHAYLIIGRGKEKLERKTEELTRKFKLKVINFPLSKIEDTRSLNSFLNLEVNSPTGIIINSIDRVTDEAANAFLKNLEEPQKDLYFFLTADSLHRVLPTIVSRCEVVNVSKGKVQKETNPKVLNFMTMTKGEKLMEVDKIKGREEAKTFVTNLIESLHDNLHRAESNFKNQADDLELLQKTLNNLEANGNVTLQLANLVINLK